MSDETDMHKWAALLRGKRNAALPEGFAEEAVARLRAIPRSSFIPRRNRNIGVFVAVSALAAAAMTIISVDAVRDKEPTPAIFHTTKTEEQTPMKLKQTVMAATTAALMAAPTETTQAGSFSSASYVQDGLIAQWDGIDNAGIGTHDPLASIWKDLKGTLDLALTAQGRWNDTANGLSVNAMSAQGSRAAPPYKTIEVVCRMDGGRILFCSGLASRIVAFDTVAKTSTAKEYLEMYFDGIKDQFAPFIYFTPDAKEIRYAAATYDDDSVSGVYRDGALWKGGTQWNDWSVGDGKVAIGGRSATEGYPWSGEVYAIRLYDRVLTEDEIKRNHIIDEARFDTIRQYIQDGLVVQWDGIDNTGTGFHDPNATTWKDLKGNLNLTLTGDGSWNAGGNALVVNGLAASNPSAAPEYKTIEVVYKKTDNGGRVLFSGGNEKRFVLFDSAGVSNNVYFSGERRTKLHRFVFDSSEICFAAACYGEDGSVLAVYQDSEESATEPKNDTWSAGTGTSIGGRTHPTYGVYPWYGEVYAIRLYDRNLSKWELAHNYRVDCKRFLTSASYCQNGLLANWDGIDNAGTGVHDASSATWKNLSPNRLELAEDGLDLTVRSGKWGDSSLMSVGSSTPAASGSTNFTMNTLEIVYQNANTNASAILFSGGNVGGLRIDRYLALGTSYIAWIDGAATKAFSGQVPGINSLVWTNPDAYANGEPLAYVESFNAGWGLGTSRTINLGCRITGNAYPFTGDIHAIRAYSGKLTAQQVAYNHKVDDIRFMDKHIARPLTWESTADGDFGTNGRWLVAQSGRSTRSVPSLGDTAILPAGNYTVTMGESWMLGGLALGTNVKLSLPAPISANIAGTPLVTVSGSVTVGAGVALVLDMEAFNREHPGETIDLISCGADSATALGALASGVRASIERCSCTVIDGRRLVYRAPFRPGTAIVIR